MSLARVATIRPLIIMILNYYPRAQWACVNKHFLEQARILMVKAGQQIAQDPLVGPRFIEVCKDANLDPKNPASIARCLGLLHLSQIEGLPVEGPRNIRRDYGGLFHAQRFLAVENRELPHYTHGLNQLWLQIPGAPALPSVKDRVVWIRDPNNAPVLEQVTVATLDAIPRDIGRFTHLEYLTIKGHWQGTFPSAMRKLHQLQRLYLNQTALRAAPAIIQDLPSIELVQLPSSVTHISDEVLAHYWRGWQLHLWDALREELKGTYDIAAGYLLMWADPGHVHPPFAFWLRQKLSIPYIPAVRFIEAFFKWCGFSPNAGIVTTIIAVCMGIVVCGINAPIILYNFFLVKVVIPLVMCVRRALQ